MYDRKCTSCGAITLDHWEPMTAPEVKCEGCEGRTERVLLPHTVNIISDDIPGGYWVKHGLCNEDGSPRKYYSKSEMKAEGARRGLINHTDMKDYIPKNRIYFT